MKNLLLIAAFFGSSLVAKAQISPISWTFTAVKTGDKMYDLKMVATIQDKWHLYSQTQPEDAVIMPTEFSFNANPLLKLEGKFQELGKMEKFTDKSLGISANQYSTSVTFIQKIKLKSNVKTNLAGSVVYQTCDDKKCLPPKTVSFTVAIK